MLPSPSRRPAAEQRCATIRRSCPDWLVFPIAGAALAILCIGVSRDYRLKHENNNALYTTFARSHLHFGLDVTRGHDMFWVRETGTTGFYAHHPPGIALVLAAVFKLTGSDGPLPTRFVAITFTLTALFLLASLLRREVGPCEGLLAAVVFAILPQSAFYGRMVNHEILALPAIIIVVASYFDFATHRRRRSAIFLAAAATAGALMAWATFFALAACGVHALLRSRQAGFRAAFLLLVPLSLSLFAFNILHILHVKQGELDDLSSIFLRRIGAGQEYGVIDWTSKMASFSMRLFCATGTIALLWLVVRVGRRWLSDRHGLRPIEEMGALFALAGGGYLVVFNWGAWQHHYWQYPLLPAVVIAVVLALQAMAVKARQGSRRWKTLLVVAMIELIAFSALGLYKRHSRVDASVVERVERLRTLHL